MTSRRKAVVLAAAASRPMPNGARAISARMGSRQGARHALQHRRRNPDGARHRRDAVRQLVGMPCGRMGSQRARVRRSQRRRRLSEAQLSVRHHGQRARAALRRRGRGLPQLHLRQVRPRDSRAAGPVRLAGLRSQGDASAARRIPHQARDQGQRRHARGAGGQARGRRRGGFSRRDPAPTTPRSIPASPFNPNIKDGRRHARASRSTRPTGPTRSTRRRSRLTR